MTTTALLPCPFCGGRAIFCGDDPKDPHDCHHILCTGCELSLEFVGNERAADEIDRLTERLAGAYASVNLRTEMLEAKAPPEATGLQDKIARAYGYLWHVNNSGVGFQFSPEKAAHMARRVLRDTLTHEQRGNAINMAATELFEILRNEGNE